MAKKRMSDEDIVQYILACKKEAENAQKEIRSVWDECWNAYKNYQDYTDKENWQHKVYCPEAFPAIKTAVGLIRRILTRVQDYFRIESKLKNDPVLERNAQNRERLTKYWFRMADFIEKFVEAIESSFVLGIGVLKLYWGKFFETGVEVAEKIEEERVFNELMGEEETIPKVYKTIELVEKEKTGLKIDVCDPYMIYFPPDGSFIIECTRKKIHEVLEGAEEGIYDSKTVNLLKEEDYGETTIETERRVRLGIAEHTNEYRKDVWIYEFWGNLINKEGQVVEKNITATVANEKYLIKKPTSNPFWHKQFPYIMINPIKMVFRKEGRPLYEGVVKLQTAINDIVNLQLDGLLFSLLKMFEVDLNNIVNTEDIQKWEPGKPIIKKGPGKAIDEIKIGSFDAQSMEMVHLLRRFFQNYTAVTDYLMGMPTVAGSPTATEVGIKTTQSNIAFEVISKAIEEQGIVKAVDMAGDLIEQFMDESSDPSVAEILGMDAMSFFALSKEEKIELIQGDFDIYAKGISSFFDNQEMLGRLVNFFKIISASPEFMVRLNKEEFLKRILKAFNLGDEENLIVEPPKMPIGIPPRGITPEGITAGTPGGFLGTPGLPVGIPNV